MRNAIRPGESGFTPIELLVVLALVAMLGTLVLPAQHRAKARNSRTACLANLERIGQAMQMYTEDFNDTFPGHRRGPASDSPAANLTNWWGATIFNYTGRHTNTFHCPGLTGERADRGTRWRWGFDIHRVGYGFNAFFLGLYPYEAMNLTVAGVSFSTQPWFKRSRIARPAQNLAVADTQPYGNPPIWSSTLWFPNACMDTKTSISKSYQGVTPDRHESVGIMVFNDGHAEARVDKNINPPVDPFSGSPKGLINSWFWDPLQRGGK